jgi:HD superfamily phosphohydrolase YqeK
MQYEQTMDYNSFLIFIADKGLKPTTEAEKSVEENNNKDLQKNIKARLPHKW